MQNPVIQRIKRRAEVCQSLPVTCGHRGNDTGNGLVTVVSLRCAVDCFLENGKSAHSKPVTFLLPLVSKYRLDVFFTLGKAQFCHRVEEIGGEYRHHIRGSGTSQPEDHADLFGCVWELADRRGHAPSALIHKKRGVHGCFNQSTPRFNSERRKVADFSNLLLTQPRRTPIRLLLHPRLTGHRLLIHSLSMALQTSGFSFRERSRRRTPSLGE